MWGISREIIVRCVFPTITNEHLDKIIALGNNYHLDDENFSDALESFEVRYREKFRDCHVEKFGAFLAEYCARKKTVLVERETFPICIMSELSSEKRGEVLIQLTGSAATAAPKCRTDVTVLSHLKNRYFQYKDAVLSKHFVFLSQLFAKTYPQEIESRLCLKYESERTVVAVIVSEDGGKLSAGNLSMQNSREIIEMDVSAVPDFLLYPGKVVAAVGNSSGQMFRVNQLLPLFPSPVSPIETPGKALNMIVACGPFTCSDNLEYEPLLALLSTLGSE